MAILNSSGAIAQSSSPPDLLLEPADDPALVAGKLAAARVVAVRFPKYGDGRGDSLGRLLRERYGYKGELRAAGAIARDHLQLLARCGFDAFELREGEDALEAAQGLQEFSEAYQATAAQPLPLFLRRA